MKKLLSYLLSIISYFFFFIILLLFHGVQWLALNLGGYEPHKRSVEIFNLSIMRCLNILGTTFHFENDYNIPENRACIFVANHQGMFDIPPIIWFLRRYHPKFISKKELAKGIPAISYNLRHGGSALIDRKDRKQSIGEIMRFAEYLKETNRSAVIFPEGTRSRNGQPKKFAVSGLQILFKKMPHALVVPITINNSWKLFRYGKFPLGIGVPIKLKVHEPIEIDTEDHASLIAKVEHIIITDIK